MTSLLLAIGIAVCVSFFCSLSEAALYTVGAAYVHTLNKSGSRIGRILTHYKENMDKPISAILIVNTAANIMGASIAGAIAANLFGEAKVFYFSIFFTLLILYCGEIIPKILGVTFNRPIAFIVSYPINIIIKILFPLIWLNKGIGKALRHGYGAAKAPEEEVAALAHISAEEGSILPLEKHIIEHVLKLDNIKAKDIMTPRSVMLIADGNQTLERIKEEALKWKHSRVPVFEKDRDNLTGIVLRRKVIISLVENRDINTPLKTLAMPIHFVPDTISGDKLLTEFLSKKEHLFGVLDEYGVVIGVVSLEDVLETLIGTEIMDETDIVADLQELARIQWSQRKAKRREQAVKPASNTGENPK